jgi:hypothetical protein
MERLQTLADLRPQSAQGIERSPAGWEGLTLGLRAGTCDRQ